MTLGDLIIKLCNDGYGGYGAFTQWLEDIKRFKEQSSSQTNSEIWFNLYNNALIVRGKIQGFFWGLYAAGYITAAERQKLVSEVDSI